MTPTPVFLISLPRSGSTLLQRLMSAHPAITTVAEPWILLPLLSVDRPGSTHADYDFNVSRRALEDFWNCLPEGRLTYVKQVGDMVRNLYTSATAPGSTHFLDKTPRYHLVLNDLVQAFPEAKFVVLWRNPLSVLASILELEGHWNLFRYEIDLIQGWQSIHQFQVSMPDSRMVIRYEDLVRDTQATMQSLFRYLELPVVDATLPTDDHIISARMGDKSGTARYQGVSTRSLDRWKEALRPAARHRWADMYLEYLGAERLADVGYDRTLLRRELATVDTVPGLGDYPWRAWGVAYKWMNAGALRHKARSARKGYGTWGHS